jgi:hypothetical protein
MRYSPPSRRGSRGYISANSILCNSLRGRLRQERGSLLGAAFLFPSARGCHIPSRHRRTPTPKGIIFGRYRCTPTPMGIIFGRHRCTPTPMCFFFAETVVPLHRCASFLRRPLYPYTDVSLFCGDRCTPTPMCFFFAETVVPLRRCVSFLRGSVVPLRRCVSFPHKHTWPRRKDSTGAKLLPFRSSQIKKDRLF